MRLHRRFVAVGVTVVMALASAATRVAAHEIDPSGTYSWVDPPPERKGNNRPPRGRRKQVPRADLSIFFTPDFQFRLTWLPEAHVTDSADITVTPLDADELGDLPSGREPDGNAYDVSIKGLDLATHPATAILVVPIPNPVVFQSPDGKRWKALPTTINDRGQAEAKIDGGGYLLAGALEHADDEPFVTVQRAWFVIAGVLVAFAVWRRWPRAVVAPAARPSSRRKTPPKRKAKRKRKR